MKRIAIVLVAIFLSSCSSFTAATHYLKSTDHFIPLDADFRVLYEPGAEEFAREVAKVLPRAIALVEAGHYLSFADSANTRVYVCATIESFHDLTGRDVRAIVMHKLFLSPLLMKDPRDIPAYLAHELSHLHLMQRMSLYNYLVLPFWFTEGLATLVSDGGGAQNVSSAEAIAAIKSGRHFEPHGKGSVLFPKTPSHWGLKPHTFYRQAMLFMAYLKGVDEKKYRNYLWGVQNKGRVDRSFESAFGTSLMTMWQRFKGSLDLARNES